MFDAVGYSTYAAHLSYQSIVLYILIGFSLDMHMGMCSQVYILPALTTPVIYLNILVGTP